MKKSELRNLIKEEIQNILKEESQIERSKMRLKNIMQKYTSRKKQNQLANLRTDRITGWEKLKSWIEVLEDEGWDDCAKYASKKLKTL